MGDQMTLEEAIRIVAQQAVWAACDGSGIAPPEWGLYPEIGENDWNAVLVEIEHITPPPAPSDFHAAYALLEARVTNDAID
jgi:hypothetical protein